MFFSQSSNGPKKNPHTPISMACIHVKIISFWYCMNFLGFSSEKNCRKLDERDTTCVWCLNSFKFCVEGYHWKVIFFAWMLAMVMRVCEKKLVSLDGCDCFSLNTSPSSLTEPPALNMMYFLLGMEWYQILLLGENSHGNHPFQIWTNSDSICMLRHVRLVF